MTELKAISVTDPGLLQSLLAQGPLGFSPDGSVELSQVYSSSYGRLYRANSALRAVVDFLSRNIAQCPIKVYHRDADGVSLPAPEHPVQRLLDHPQERVSRSRFMRQLVADKAIYDVAAVWKIRENFDPTPGPNGRIRNSGTVRNLFRIPVPLVMVSQSSLSSPTVFRVQTGRDAIAVPAEDIIWMPGYSPESNIQGVPPLETLRSMLAEEYAAVKDRERSWNNGPRINGALERPAGTDPSNSDAIKRWYEDWKALTTTDRGAYGTPMLPPDVKMNWGNFTPSSESMQYLETRNLVREECCRAYGVQPQLLGVTQANFASLDMFHQMLYQDTLAAWMVPIQEDLEAMLLEEFESIGSGYYLDFSIQAKLMGSFSQQADIAQRAVGGPWATADEIREKLFGWAPLPDGQGTQLITPSNVVRGGGPQANPLDATNQYGGKAVQLHLIETEGDTP